MLTGEPSCGHAWKTLLLVDDGKCPLRGRDEAAVFCACLCNEYPLLAIVGRHKAKDDSIVVQAYDYRRTVGSSCRPDDGDTIDLVIAESSAELTDIEGSTGNGDWVHASRFTSTRYGSIFARLDGDDKMPNQIAPSGGCARVDATEIATPQRR